MYFVDEIEQYLTAHQAKLGKKERNVELFLFYLGFMDVSWPTLDETGYRFRDPNAPASNYKRKAQLPQQIRDKMIRILSKAKPPLTSITTSADILLEKELWASADYLDRLCRAGIVPDPKIANVRGIFEVLKRLNYVTNYDLCDRRMKPLSPTHFSLDDQGFLVSINVLEKVKSGLEKAKNTSHELGLVSFSFFVDQFDKTYLPYQNLILEIITAGEEFICFTDKNNGQIYFHHKNRKVDGFTSAIEKVFCVTQKVRLYDLALAIGHAFLRERGMKIKNLVPTEVIQEFLFNHPEIQITPDNWVTYTGRKKIELPSIEHDLHIFLLRKGIATAAEVDNYLKDKKYSSGYIQQTKAKSPILNRYWERGKQGYLYKLIGQNGSQSELENLIPVDNLDDAFADLVEEGKEVDDPPAVVAIGIEDGRKGNEKTFSDIKAAYDRADENGRVGEERIERYLSALRERREIVDFDWISNKHRFASYDFEITQNDGKICYIDVKTTDGPFSGLIYISRSEIFKMTGDIPYYLYRVSGLNSDREELRISESMNEIARKICLVIAQLPDGFESDGFTLQPARMNFGKGVSLNQAIYTDQTNENNIG